MMRHGQLVFAWSPSRQRLDLVTVVSPSRPYTTVADAQGRTYQVAADLVGPDPQELIKR